MGASESNPEFLEFRADHHHLKGLWKQTAEPHSQSLRFSQMGPKGVCISKKFPGDANVQVSKPHVENHEGNLLGVLRQTSIWYNLFYIDLTT